MKVAKIILKKALAILVISLFFTLLNPTQAYAGTGTVKIKLTTSTSNDASTDNTIEVIFRAHNGSLSKVFIEEDLGKGEVYETEAYINFDPWMLKDVRLHQTGSDGWLPGYWQIDIIDDQRAVEWPKTYPGTLGWMSTDEDEGVEYTDWWDLSSYTKRNIVSDAVSKMGSIVESGVGHRTVNFSQTDASFYFCDWNYNNWGSFINVDETITDQYGIYWPNYSVNNYGDAPGEIKVVVDSRFEKGVHYGITHNSPGLSYDFYPLPALWDKMTAEDMDTVVFQLDWSFNPRSTNNTTENPATRQCYMTFNRKVFRVRNLLPIEAESVGRGNYYYNKDKNDVTITGQVYNTIGVDPAAIWGGAISGTASLIRGNGADGEKICDLTVSKGTNLNEIIFRGTVPDNYSTGNDGIYIKVDNITLGNYVLSGDPSTYFSAYKVDTITPQFSIVDEDGEDKDISGEWANVHKFYIVSSEAVSGAGGAVVSYKLYDEDDQLVRITNYSGSGGDSSSGQTVPADTNIISGAEVNLKLSDYIEGEYRMEVQGSDTAKNPGEATISDIWLDNKAPAATVTETLYAQAADGTKRNDYEFSISDASGSGRVYYCFVEEGAAIPLEDSGEWKYVEIGASSTTAVIKVNKDQDFIGRLYYYTVDDLENDSYVQSGNEYYSTDVNLYNGSVTTAITVEYTTKGLSSYDISFDIDGPDRLEYQWVEKNSNKSGFAQSSYKEYTGEDIGAAAHTGDDRKEYLFDGTYELRYKIINKDSGNYIEDSYTFVFDNSTPTIELPVWNNGTKVREVQPARISITDTGTIKEAYCKIVDMENNAVDAPSIPLTIESSGSVNTEIDVSPTSSGIYGLKIYAEDINGNFKEVGYGYLDKTEDVLDDGREQSYYAKPDMRFAVRIQKPELKALHPYRTAETEILEKLGDNIYRTGKGDYTLKFSSQEDIANVGNFSDTYLKYQISSDGITWSSWQDAGLMSKNTDTGINYMDFTIKNPYVLTEGQNKFYVRTACYNFKSGDAADKQAELSRDPGSELISAPAEVIIVLDTVLPKYNLVFDSTDRTSGNVYATLTMDNTSGKTYNMTSPSWNLSFKRINAESFRLTININLNEQIRIFDNLGNFVLAQVKVDWIDRVAPAAELVECAAYSSGDRTDGRISVKIKDAKKDTTRLALIDAGGIFGEDDFERFNQYKSEGKIKANFIAAETVYGEVNEDYTIYIRGVSGNYSLGYSSSDALGNTISNIIPGTDLNLVDAEAELEGVSYNPEITTKSYTEATLKFNVPVAVLPNDRVTDDTEENLRLAAVYGRSADAKYALEHKFIYTKKESITYYVCDEAARPEQISVSMEGVQFIEGFESSIEYMLNGEIVEVNDKWIGIEADGDLQVVITPNSAYEAQYFIPILSPEKMTLDELVSTTGDDVIEDGTEEEEEPITDEDGTKEEEEPITDEDGTEEEEEPITEEDRAEEEEEPITDEGGTEEEEEPITEGEGTEEEEEPITEGEGTGEEEEPITGEEGTEEGEDEIHEPAEEDMTEEDALEGLFAAILLAAGDDMVLNIEDSIIVADPPYEVASTFSAIGYSGPIFTRLTFDVLKNGSNTKQCSFMSYTMEGTPEERLQEESIYITNIDETAPAIAWRLSKTTPTNTPVDAYISFSDAESGIGKVEVSYNGEGYVEIDKGEYLTDNEIVVEINDEHDVFSVKVTNNAGLSSEDNDISAPNIDKTPITVDEHYTVEYSYENYAGEWVPVEEGGYYRSVKAEIVPTDTKKELRIANNGGSSEKILTNALQSFVFNIRDTAGNAASQSVEYTRYDTEAPVVYQSISPASKTNAPVTVNITAEDSINTIAHCEVYCKIDNELEEIEGVEKVGEGQYTAIAEDSGDYVIFVWDGAGNKATHNFQITNIDKSPVEITSIRYSTPRDIKTGQTILVTVVSFNKPDVSMLSIAIPDGIALTQSDIVVSSDLRNIRFKKNGSVEATFVDAYGNIGQEIITVDNIKTTPPMCEGKYELSEKLNYATISFQSMKSEFGLDLEPDLSKVYVVSGLIKSAAVATAEKARITVNNNGTYNFTLSDEVGNSQTVSVKVEGIDKEPPKVTGVSWNYGYMKENTGTGDWEYATESNTDIAPGTDGYTLSGDTLPETNQDVTVTVTTDKDIVQIGSFDGTPKKETAVKYSKNGVFSFNLEAINETSVLYGVDVKLIDKDKPLLQFDNTDELIFIEGDIRPESKYDISKLYDFTAYDMRSGEAVEIPKEKVKINFGGFNPDDITKNVFNRNSPYYITYSVADSAGNIAEVTRTVRLIGLTDTVALINGSMPNANSISSVNGTGTFTVSLKNHSGKAYVKYEQGMHTIGEMKYVGNAVEQNEDGSFTINAASGGWYTVSVQTDRKDFFNIMVYINLEGSSK